MNDNDKWLILDTPELKRLYDPIQEGDEVWCGYKWDKPIGTQAMNHAASTLRRLRSRAWLKASEHPMRFPAYVCAPTSNVFYLPNAANAPQTGTPALWLWQPAPQLPDPPAKEDACERAFQHAEKGLYVYDNVEKNNRLFFKAGWEARGGK